MSDHVYRKLQRSLVLLILLVSVLPLVLLAVFIALEGSYVYRNSLERQIAYRARAGATKVDLFLEERTAVLASIADLHGIDDLVAGETLADIFGVINNRAGGFVDLGVIDSDGNHVAYVGPYSLAGLNYLQQPWFAEVMSKGVSISDVYMGYRKVPHFVIAVRRQEKQRLWILRATIDSGIFNVLAREAQVGKTGDAFIINRSGACQTKPRFDADILSDSGLEAANFVEGAIIEKTSPRGNRLLYTGARLRAKDWLLIITQDADEGLWGFSKIRNIQLLSITIAVAIVIVATLLAARFAVGQLQVALRRAGEATAQRLQENKLAALGTMAAGIAHEINNPLAVIKEQSGWMHDLLEEEEFKQSPNYKEYRTSLGKVSLHVERARTIIADMLNYARKMEPRLESVDVNGVIEQTISFLRSITGRDNITIETRLAPDMPLVAGDRSRLQQVFFNIITNAIEATGPDGLIQVTTTLKDSQIAIDITDNGPGIPPDVQSRIFDPFFTTKQTGTGTGLGLWVCFTILESMGGTISFTSEMGKGTTFTITLAAAPPGSA